jgi:selenocysteine lyase/cysteine desulfurase
VTALDLNFVRGQFPAFSSPILAKHCFFENAGGSYPCRAVVDRLNRFYNDRKVQPYAPYPGAQLAGAEMDEARSRLSALMAVGEAQLCFGPSTSANTFVLANAVRQWLRAEVAAARTGAGQAPAIVVTNQDHEANSGVWRRLADDGFEIREWQIDAQSGLLDLAALAELLADGRVRLAAFPHCSNVVGAINPVAEICAMLRQSGARSVVDGVSYAPHGLPDFPALGADVYLFSAYKTYGPHQGIMLIGEEFGAELPAQGHWFNAEPLSKRFTPAGPDHAQVAACAGIADYIDALHAHHFGADSDPAARNRKVHDLMRLHEAEVVAPLLDFLARRNDLRLIGPRDAQKRAPTVAVALERAAYPVAAELAAQGIACGGGDFYARRPLQALGVDPAKAVLRLSLVHYNTADEVARLIHALEMVL